MTKKNDGDLFIRRRFCCYWNHLFLKLTINKQTNKKDMETNEVEDIFLWVI